MFKVEHIKEKNTSILDPFLNRNYRKYFLIFLDLIGIFAAFSLAQNLRGVSGNISDFYSVQFLGVVFFIIVSTYVFELYQFDYRVGDRKIFLSLCFALLFSFVGISIWSYILGVKRFASIKVYQ